MFDTTLNFPPFFRSIAYLETRSDAASVMRVAIPLVADSYYGITGDTALNAAGDLKFAHYDFWSVMQENGTYNWKKSGELQHRSRDR